MSLKLGDVAPDFEAETTEGPIKFHDWIGDSWAILFSHPKDFTPVCTTELGYMASIEPEFEKRNVKIIGLSVDPLENHEDWVNDIEATQGSRPEYPIISDADFHVSKLYDMLPAEVSGDPGDRTPADNQTVRNVFVIGPDKKVKLILVYPMTTGRNFDEVLRVIDSLQLTAQSQSRDAGQLADGRRRDHRRLGLQRRSERDLPGRLGGAPPLHPDRPPARREGLAEAIEELGEDPRRRSPDQVALDLVGRGVDRDAAPDQAPHRVSAVEDVEREGEERLDLVRARPQVEL